MAIFGVEGIPHLTSVLSQKFQKKDNIFPLRDKNFNVKQAKNSRKLELRAFCGISAAILPVKKADVSHGQFHTTMTLAGSF